MSDYPEWIKMAQKAWKGQDVVLMYEAKERAGKSSLMLNLQRMVFETMMKKQEHEDGCKYPWCDLTVFDAGVCWWHHPNNPLRVREAEQEVES